MRQLREALAGIDHDFSVADSEPRSKRVREKPLRAKSRGSRGAKPSRGRMIGRLVVGLGAAAAVGIFVNALVLQEARHPAPLFAHSVPANPPATPKVAKAAPTPAPRPWVDQAAPAPTREKPTETVPIESSQAEKSDKPAAARRQTASLSSGESGQTRDDDAISKLLKGQTAPSTPQTEPSKTVRAAQRALVKLGFVLEADGVAGAATRRAIERYERERGLPVKGELTPKILHRLKVESGIPID